MRRAGNQFESLVVSMAKKMFESIPPVLQLRAAVLAFCSSERFEDWAT
jgi:hypothetical protein